MEFPSPSNSDRTAAQPENLSPTSQDDEPSVRTWFTVSISDALLTMDMNTVFL